MKIYLTGSTLDWFNNHEYFQKILKMVWIDHDDDDMSDYVNNYVPLFIKNIMNAGDVSYYNDEVLFLSCLDNDLNFNPEAFLKGLTLTLSELVKREYFHIELIIPSDDFLNKSVEESIVKSIMFSQFKHSLYLKSMTKLEDGLKMYS